MCVSMGVATGTSPAAPSNVIYLTQWLYIGITPHLVFYDCGSNINIISEEVAENKDL